MYAQNDLLCLYKTKGEYLDWMEGRVTFAAAAESIVLLRSTFDVVALFLFATEPVAEARSAVVRVLS
jgi:hypothetical protein